MYYRRMNFHFRISLSGSKTDLTFRTLGLFLSLKRRQPFNDQQDCTDGSAWISSSLVKAVLVRSSQKGKQYLASPGPAPAPEVPSLAPDPGLPLLRSPADLVAKSFLYLKQMFFQNLVLNRAIIGFAEPGLPGRTWADSKSCSKSGMVRMVPLVTAP